MTKKFLQLHLLTSYPAALLNRDDAGFAKRLPFGGSVRTRISSQCLKRHWRTHQGAHSLASLGSLAVRSRLTFAKRLYEPLLAAGIDDALAQAVTRALTETVLGQSLKAKSKAEAEDATGATLQTSQVTVLGNAELDWLLAEAQAICSEAPDAKKVAEVVKARYSKDGKKNIEALKKASAGLDAAMFGRMVTSDILARGDAAVHVAHAFTVHEEHSESDYFSAVDDLLQAEEGQGSGHINSTELTSGLYYLYVAVDLPLLVSNLEGCPLAAWEGADRELAARVVEHFVHLAATVSPGAKLGSTAPHAYAQCVLAEVGDMQPRTLANAFMKPVRISQGKPDLLENAYAALAAHLGQFDGMYGKTTERRLAAMGPVEPLGPIADTVPLQALTRWLGEEVRGAASALA